MLLLSKRCDAETRGICFPRAGNGDKDGQTKKKNDKPNTNQAKNPVQALKVNPKCQDLKGYRRLRKAIRIILSLEIRPRYSISFIKCDCTGRNVSFIDKTIFPVSLLARCASEALVNDECRLLTWKVVTFDRIICTPDN